MKRSHLIFIPLPHLTHLVPAVQLAKQLINRQPHLSVTFVLMKLPFDPKAVSYSESISGADSALNFVHLPDPNFSSDAFSPAEYFSQVIDGQKPLVKKAVAEIIAHHRTPDPTTLAGLVIDMFCTSMIDVANDFRVPTYSFYIIGAVTLGTFYFHSLGLGGSSNGETITDYSEYSDSDLEMSMSMSMPIYANPFPVKLLPSSYFDKRGLPWLLHHARRLRETKGILLNTFEELEPHALDFLGNENNHLPRIYPVGPVIELQGFNNRETMVMKWLDDQPISSVVLLSFGSGGSFKAEQVKEIAYALERSGHRFIWSLRWPPGNTPTANVPWRNDESFEEVLPEGFPERTNGIGVVLPWVPQLQVLSHPSVGGFVTHCGWSSLLEGVYCGVPMAVWPLHSDQQMSAFTLVKELKIGVEIKMDYRLDFKNNDPIIVKADQIENGIRQLMDSTSGIREKVKEIRKKQGCPF